MLYYFRTQMYTRSVLNDEGKVVGKELVNPVEVALELTPEEHDAMVCPGALYLKVNSKTLDLVYGSSTALGEILKRDVNWLNDRLQ